MGDGMGLKILLLMLPSFMGCSLIFSEEKSEAPVEASADSNESPTEHKEENAETSKSEKPKRGSSNISEIELKQAKMWARIDELEGDLSSEKQKVALLERGMKTGIIPDELKKKKPVEEKKPVHSNELAKDFKDIEQDISKKTDESKKKAQAEASRKLTDEEFRLKISKAQDHYRAGSFGAALAELGAIQRDHGDTPDGAVAYWTGRNWLALKEFQTGINKLSAFMAQYSASQYVGRAKLEIARAQNQLGLKNRAVQTLQDLIKSHPNEESSEMAQMELERMKKTL